VSGAGTASARAKICLDLTPLETIDRHGGIGRYALRLAERLEAAAREEGFDAAWCGLLESDGAPIDLAEALERASALKPPIDAPEHRRRRRERVSAALAAAGVDLFHSTSAGPPPRGLRTRLVATVYDLVPLVMPRKRGAAGALSRWALRTKLRRALGRADRLLAISARTRDDLIERLRLPAHRLDVTPLGVDGAAFAAAAPPGEAAALRARRGLPARFFLCVGSDHYRKNQSTLFAAWRRVAAEIPEGLVVVGKSLYASALDDLLRDAESLGVPNRVRRFDDVDDVELAAFYRAATAAVAPSLYEGFGMTVLEAFAAGAPVLAARNGAYEEVGGDAAAYFAPTDTDGLAALLRRASTDGAWRDALRERGARRAAAFGWDRTARATVAAYRRALSGLGPRPGGEGSAAPVKAANAGDR